MQGLSLIELMVALTLGLILIAGISEIFVQSKHGYRIQEATARIQESARYALAALGRDLREADFWGGVDQGSVYALPATLASAAAAPCSDAWFANYREGIRGYDGAAGSPLAGCTGNYVANTDLVVVRHADPNARFANNETTSSSDALLYRSVVGRAGYLFLQSNWSGALAALPDPADGGAFNYRLRSAVFYIRDFNSDGTNRPTLYVNATDTGSSQPLVEGIEQMQLSYGVDVDGDRTVDRYLAASDVATADWAKVLSVRVGLIVRADLADASFNDEQTYAMPGGYDFKPSSDTSRLPRKLFVRDFQLRNRVRG